MDCSTVTGGIGRDPFEKNFGSFFQHNNTMSQQYEQLHGAQQPHDPYADNTSTKSNNSRK